MHNIVLVQVFQATRNFDHPFPLLSNTNHSLGCLHKIIQISLHPWVRIIIIIRITAEPIRFFMVKIQKNCTCYFAQKICTRVLPIARVAHWNEKWALVLYKVAYFAIAV